MNVQSILPEPPEWLETTYKIEVKENYIGLGADLEVVNYTLADDVPEAVRLFFEEEHDSENIVTFWINTDTEEVTLYKFCGFSVSSDRLQSLFHLIEDGVKYTYTITPVESELTSLRVYINGDGIWDVFPRGKHGLTTGIDEISLLDYLKFPADNVTPTGELLFRARIQRVDSEPLTVEVTADEVVRFVDSNKEFTYNLENEYTVVTTMDDERVSVTYADDEILRKRAMYSL